MNLDPSAIIAGFVGGLAPMVFTISMGSIKNWGMSRMKALSKTYAQDLADDFDRLAKLPPVDQFHMDNFMEDLEFIRQLIEVKAKDPLRPTIVHREVARGSQEFLKLFVEIEFAAKRHGRKIHGGNLSTVHLIDSLKEKAAQWANRLWKDFG